MCHTATVTQVAEQSALDQDAVDDMMQRLFELRVEVQSNLSDVNIELASVKRKVQSCSEMRSTLRGIHYLFQKIMDGMHLNLANRHHWGH